MAKDLAKGELSGIQIKVSMQWIQERKGEKFGIESLDKSFGEFYYKRGQINEVVAKKRFGVRGKFLKVGCITEYC